MYVYNTDNLHYILQAGFYNTTQCDLIIAELNNLTFNSDAESQVKIFGKYVNIPRLQTAFGESGTNYNFSGNSVSAKPWPEFLLKIRADLMQYLMEKIPEINWRDLNMNYVLVNKYRDGNDYIGYHSDDEKDLIKINNEVFILSLSFGASREFCFQSKQTRELDSVLLNSGDLVIMRGETQKYWKHSVPKNSKIKTPRYNLTFRFMQNTTKPSSSINTLNFYRQTDDYGFLSNFYGKTLDSQFVLKLPDNLTEYLNNPQTYMPSNNDFDYLTSEHPFQICKLINANNESRTEYLQYINIMRQASTPSKVAALGRQKITNDTEVNAIVNKYRPFVTILTNWNEIRDQVMYFIVYQKFKQNPHLLIKLKNTNDKILVEHTVNDKYWADGGNGTGKNMLGKILMRVRSEL